MPAILKFVIRFVLNSYRLCSVLFRTIFKKNDVSISNRFLQLHKRGIHTQTDTHTDTHDDSIRRNAMLTVFTGLVESRVASQAGDQASIGLNHTTKKIRLK